MISERKKSSRDTASRYKSFNFKLGITEKHCVTLNTNGNTVQDTLKFKSKNSEKKSTDLDCVEFFFYSILSVANMISTEMTNK